MFRTRKALIGAACLAWSCFAWSTPAPDVPSAAAEVPAAVPSAELDIHAAAPHWMADVRDAVMLELSKRLADQSELWRATTPSSDS